MSETTKIIILSLVAAGLLSLTMIFIIIQPVLAATIPATLWAIAAIFRAIATILRAIRRGDHDENDENNDEDNGPTTIGPN